MSRDSLVDRRIGYLIKRVQAGLRSEMDHALAPQGLTTPQYAALSNLENAPGLSNAELARRCFVTPQTMIRIVASLEEKNMVTRSEHPSHGRILETALTTAGQKALSASHQHVLNVERRMVSSLSESERRTLAQLLERCAATFGSADD
jgi:DNA-binding MarR family transcriptional regulator